MGELIELRRPEIESAVRVAADQPGPGGREKIPIYHHEYVVYTALFVWLNLITSHHYC